MPDETSAAAPATDATPDPAPRESAPIVGIDLGTTNSLVAVADAAGPRVLEFAGVSIVPSVVRFGAAGEVVVGAEARDHAVEFPTETIHSAKRLMGRALADVAERADLPFELVAGPRGLATVRAGDRDSTPQEIAAHVLARLRDVAADALGCEVSRAVVTVPAYFDDAQRQATRDAGRLAGLDVVRIVNEPTAAALAYGIGARGGDPQIVAIYDLGGGTFDVSILSVQPAESDDDAGSDFVQVLATAGDTHLGGDDVDRALIDLFMGEIRERYGVELAFPPAARQALRTFAERTKIALSTDERASVRIDLGDGRVYERVVERRELDALVAPLIERTLRQCTRALKDAKLAVGDVDRVVLVGGSTRMPAVRDAVRAHFGAEPYVALDPDRVVALGAAVQASIMSGERTDMLLLDVIPLSLGLETVGGAVAKLLVRNSTVPARAAEMFSTSVDGQTNVLIHVVQGERELVADCRSLGRFDLRGIPPMPAGMPQIEVTFLVDANGVLSVDAVEKRSGRRASIQVVPTYGLTAEEVDRIEAESFAHAREDMHAHRVIDLRVNASLDLKWIGTSLERVRDVLEPAYLAELEKRMTAVRTFVDDAGRDPAAVDADAFHAAKDALDRASMRMHEVAITQSLREE